MKRPVLNAAILNRELPLPRAFHRIPMLLVELGVTAIGLILAIDWLGRDRSGLSLLIKGDYVGWALLADVALALFWRCMSSGGP
jgi:hypothetical protein